jgi:hypothetical protein
MAPNWGSSFQVTLHRKYAMWRCGADVKILMISAITRSDNAKIHWMTFLDCLNSWAETVWQHAVTLSYNLGFSETLHSTDNHLKHRNGFHFQIYPGPSPQFGTNMYILLYYDILI